MDIGTAQNLANILGSTGQVFFEIEEILHEVFERSDGGYEYNLFNQDEEGNYIKYDGGVMPYELPRTAILKVQNK